MCIYEAESILVNKALRGWAMGKLGLFLALLVSFFGCSATNQPEPDSENILILKSLPESEQCQFLGEVVATEGVWYNYWFVSNYNLTKGARDGLRNKALALGGNVIVIETTDFTYTTSTVFIGSVYHCTRDTIGS